MSWEAVEAVEAFLAWSERMKGCGFCLRCGKVEWGRDENILLLE